MNLEDQVLSIVRSNTEQKQAVNLASNLRQELHLDSFGLLMIINALEEAFGITVEDGDFSRVQTMADVVELLRGKYHCH
jgi:acyl carrier protein